MPSVPPLDGVTLRQSPIFVMCTTKAQGEVSPFPPAQACALPMTLKDSENSTAVESLASFKHVRLAVENHAATHRSATDPLPSPKPSVFRPGDSCPQAGRWALSRVRSTEGLPLTARSPPGRYPLLKPGRWVLSLVLGLATGVAGCLPYPLWGWRYGNGETYVRLIAIAIPGGLGYGQQ